jgi:hypothetical protein
VLRGAVWAIAVATLASAAGCRQILGLDPPTRGAGPGIDGGSDAAITDDDQDGDGVPDSADNCPTVANADQADYDRDGHGDVCDLCPHLASAADPDSDRDGVGDACDPRPGLVDKRSYWTSFRDPGEIATWTQSGTWTVGPGGVTQTSSSTPSATLELPGNLNRPYVATTVTPSSSAPIPSAVAITVVGTSSYGCGVYATSSSTQLVEQVQSVTTQTPWTEPYAGAQIAMTQNLVTDEQDCEAYEAGGSVRAMQSLGSATSGTVGLYTVDTPATFAYLFVVETSP